VLHKYKYSISDKKMFRGPAKKHFIKGKTYYKGNVKLGSFLDPHLYYYLKPFNYKKHKCTLSGQLGNISATPDLFYPSELKKN
jgi:hypothetical protein